MEFIWTLVKGIMRYFIKYVEKRNIRMKDGANSDRA